MEVKNKDKYVRCVHKKTGAVGYNLATNAYDKYWQKSTGFVPQPEPATAEVINPEVKETKKDTNVKTTEATTNDGTGRNTTSGNAGRN